MKATANPQGLCKQIPAKSSREVPLLSPAGGTWELEAELSRALESGDPKCLHNSWSVATAWKFPRGQEKMEGIQ